MIPPGLRIPHHSHELASLDFLPPAHHEFRPGPPFLCSENEVAIWSVG
jgi:hypothetical protein